MASLVWPKATNRKPYILVVVNGERQRISFVGVRNWKLTKNKVGKLPESLFKEVHRKVHFLERYVNNGGAIDPDLVCWLEKIPDALHKRLAAAGLVEPRRAAAAVTVADLVARFAQMKTATIEASSAKRMQIELDRFKGWAGTDTPIKTFTAGSAADFQSWLAGKVSSEAAQRTCCRYVKSAFGYAVEHEWLTRNPFRKMKSSSIAGSREHYISPEQAELVLYSIDQYFKDDPMKAIQWKLLFGLARYGGLRAPSESLAITWRGVDWENSALIVPVRKTRRYAAERRVPIVPELLKILNKAWDLTPNMATRIVTLSASNIRRKFPKILEKAKIPVWADLFQALRQSCETHLISIGHPQHAVSQWLGHSERVSKDHYLMVTSETFQAATKTAASEPPAPYAPVRAAEPAQPLAGPRKPQNRLSGDTSEDCSKDVPCKDLRSGARKTEVARAGIEPATHGFSIRCSTDQESHKSQGIDAAGPESGLAGMRKWSHLVEPSENLDGLCGDQQRQVLDLMGWFATLSPSEQARELKRLQSKHST